MTRPLLWMFVMYLVRGHEWLRVKAEAYELVFGLHLLQINAIRNWRATPSVRMDATVTSLWG